MRISIPKLKDLVYRVLQQYGYNDQEIPVIFETLLWAQRRQTTQGFNKLLGWRVEKQNSNSGPCVEVSQDNLLLVDAHQSNHIVALNFAVDKLLEVVGNKPIFVAGVKNTYNSAAALGYYSEKVANSGRICIMMSAADPGVVAYGGKSAVFGTNPISVAIPTTSHPLLLDMSTAALTWGDLVKYNSDSKPLPPGLAFDDDGNPTTDPKKAMDGTVTTFDKSPKSSGLALMIQILAGPLVGSLYSSNYKECQYGSLIITINPDQFGDRELFLSRVNQMICEIKDSEKADGFDEILMPGERGYRCASQQETEVELSDNLYSKLKALVDL
jgi:LDH2 family malate/lactate/ureidoglycolate dehydrogenase